MNELNYYVGGVLLFAGAWAPVNWLPCDGRLLPITQQYSALFAILGTVYGGDGQTTFALPKIAPPIPGMTYIICLSGIFPVHPQ